MQRFSLYLHLYIIEREIKYLLSLFMMKRGMTVVIALFCLFTACREDAYVHVKFDQKTFNEQKQLWQASNTKDYEYHLFASGYMMYDGKIVVENGGFKEEEILNEISVPSIGMLSLGYSTIDRIYEEIEEAFKFKYYKEISVEYDKINHIPITICYILNPTPGLAVDGTFDYSIINFKKSTD